MIHALTLLVIVLFAAPLARFIPLSALAAILLVVSYNLGEWREIPELFKQSRFEIAAWLVTFLLTVFADLTGCGSGHDSGGVGVHYINLRDA